MNFNDPKINIFNIELDLLQKPSEICRRMVNVTDYCYAFTHTTGVMKFGQSGRGTGAWGERIYRQAWHIPGWPTTIGSGSGHEMADIVRDFYPNIHKDEVFIKVWDLSNIAFLQNKNRNYERLQFENYLIDLYSTVAGIAPPGNKRTGAYIKTRSVVADTTIDNLFTFI
jgi:hypothetical protein